jgi:hydrogenase 3 maturation protease
METVLKDIFQGKVVIVGIGNIMRGDDAFGPALIEKLNGRVKAVCIDAGSAPENYVRKIANENPDTILLIDAVHLDLAPGRYQIFRPEEIVKSGFTTHDISPALFIDYLKDQTKADIYMLGIQPERLALDEEMSDSLKGALEDISRMIMEANNA